MANKQVIDVVARFSGDIKNINTAIDGIESKLEGLKLAPNAEKSFLNLISRLKNELSGFEAKAQSGISGMADSRALERSGKKVIDLYNQIVNQIKVMGSASGTSFEKMFPEAVSKDIKEAAKALESYNKKHDETEDKVAETNKELQKQLDRLIGGE